MQCFRQNIASILTTSILAGQISPPSSPASTPSPEVLTMYLRNVLDLSDHNLSLGILPQGQQTQVKVAVKANQEFVLSWYTQYETRHTQNDANAPATAPLFPGQPASSDAEDVDMPDAVQLALVLLRMANGEGDNHHAQPQNPKYDPEDESEWVPEYYKAILWPASDTPWADHTFLRAFYNHTRTHGQFWPVS